MIQFNIEDFVASNITKRKQSLFWEDIEDNYEELKREISGKRILVIGGAGTIGSSFIKAILPFGPRNLTVVDYSENGLAELTRDLRSQELIMPEEYCTYPFDFGSHVFAKMFCSTKFDIVACFAAHKHVRSEKDHFAIEAMINNNVFNTKKLLDLALKSEPKHFFSVSTDKAANPVNVMGASKKLMEDVLMSNSKALKISTARFANVAFSNGSLLAGFIDRMMKGQPLSAPVDVKRYFVSPVESGQLCMLACIIGKSGEIFFPKLQQEQMMKFSDIAELFLEALGFKPDYCNTEEEARLKVTTRKSDSEIYPVYFFKSDTSGEKLFEEFYTMDDAVDMGKFISIGVIQNRNVKQAETINAVLSEMDKVFSSTTVDKGVLVALLSKFLPGFKHIETGKSLDNRM